MKAISIKQPWATLIAAGFKTIELRTWATKHRGELLVCSSATVARDPRAQYAIDAFGLSKEDMPLGQAMCVIRVLDVRAADRCDRDQACATPAQDEQAWIIEWVRDVERVPVKGRLGFFDVNVNNAA